MKFRSENMTIYLHLQPPTREGERELTGNWNSQCESSKNKEGENLKVPLKNSPISIPTGEITMKVDNPKLKTSKPPKKSYLIVETAYPIEIYLNNELIIVDD